MNMACLVAGFDKEERDSYHISGCLHECCTEAWRYLLSSKFPRTLFTQVAGTPTVRLLHFPFHHIDLGNRKHKYKN